MTYEKHPSFSLPCVSSDFNTNNAWGFGGAFGVKFVFADNVYAKIGIACYRHMKGKKFITVYHNDERIFDECFTKAQLRNADNLICSLLIKTDEIKSNHATA